MDLKLIALTYTLEAQIHGIQHLRDCPPPIHTVNVKRLPEKDMPGWGSNVPNIEEWEALEHASEDGSNSNSKILPLKDLNLNVVSNDQQSIEGGSMGTAGESLSVEQEDGNVEKSRQHRKYPPVKKEVKIEGKKMVADGVDATMGQFDENAGEFVPAVSRSTRRRYLRRKARREMSEVLSEKDDKEDATEDLEKDDMRELINSEEVLNGKLGESKIVERDDGAEDISAILHQMRLEEESLNASNDDSTLEDPAEGLHSNDLKEADVPSNNSENVSGEVKHVEIDDGPENLDITSENGESICASHTDDITSEHSWTLRSLSESTVACITSDYAMQNVLLQMGLRLVAPGGMQIRELHRFVLYLYPGCVTMLCLSCVLMRNFCVQLVHVPVLHLLLCGFMEWPRCQLTSDVHFYFQMGTTVPCLLQSDHGYWSNFLSQLWKWRHFAKGSCNSWRKWYHSCSTSITYFSAWNKSEETILPKILRKL